MPIDFTIPPYSLDKTAKQSLLLNELSALSTHHKNNCEEYKAILTALNYQKAESLADIPYLPVNLFKKYSLKSIPDTDVIKTLTSSGTTSQQVSRIFLNKETSMAQIKALSCIMQSYLGKSRLPMIILDTRAVIKNRKLFSARGAGILGLSNFGRNHFYLLDEDMNIDLEGLTAFLEKFSDSKILLFGFTFMVWQYVHLELLKQKKTIDLKNGILIHSGGWKKLIEQSVDNDTFKAALKESMGLEEIYNFYGMVEQTGAVYIECSEGALHAPFFSDILLRDPDTLAPIDTPKKEGIIEVLSPLPTSYPGHALLTEDLGEILGEDDCPCGRLGKYFIVKGRIPRAELRGCSDTHAYDN